MCFCSVDRWPQKGHNKVLYQKIIHRSQEPQKVSKKEKSQEKSLKEN